MSSFTFTPSKRPYERSESNGKGKWQKYSHNQPLRIPPGSTVFRILCPASKTGGIIGKGGAVVSKIRQETGAKVRVEEALPGCDERVIIIVGSDKEAEVMKEEAKEDDEDEEKKTAEEGDMAKENENGENNEEDKEEEEAVEDDTQPEKVTSFVQKALMLVFERMVEGEREAEGGDEEGNGSFPFVVRLLVLANQVGCLLGKAGSKVKQMSADSGAEIRILPRDQHPLCATPSDELVQITGEVDGVRKALQSVSQKLLKNPSNDYDSIFAVPSGPPQHSVGNRSDSHPTPKYPFPAHGTTHASTWVRDGADYHSNAPHSNMKFLENLIPGRMEHSQDAITFRLLCHNAKVGGVIGKGGSIIRTIQHDTGCDIKVVEGPSNSDDRIVVISGPVQLEERISAAQDAVLRIQTRIARGTPDVKEKSSMARVLVSSHQIGCLLGKGGHIISEMRKLSGAQIRILAKEQIPMYASENEEIVQMNGEFEAVQEALLQITSRLKHQFLREGVPSGGNNPQFPDQAPQFPSFMGRQEFSPPGMFSNLGPAFPKFDSGGGGPLGGFRSHNERPPFVINIHGPGVPPHISDRNPSSAPWRHQGPAEGGGPLGFPDFGAGPQRKLSGFGGASQPPIITSTTVEVVVPRSIVPVIYGEDGGCLKQIRQISDARITITDPKPGATETAIIISGTPEQTHAAQSLIQAFVMSEQENP